MTTRTTTTATTIRVMLVDDHDLLREGLALFLQTRPDLDLVAEAKNGEDAVRICGEQHPDVVLMDLKLPQMNGIEATHRIRTLYPDVQIIVLTSFADDALVESVIQAGAISYLLKTVNTDELAAAIHEAYVGKATLSAEATQALVNVAQQPDAEYSLTQRQLDVLRLMVAGQTNQQIAQALTISISTVKKHVSNILTALNTDSRTHATAIAVQHALVDASNENVV